MFTGTVFNERAESVSYIGADQLEGQPSSEPSTPVPGRFLPISEELGLFEPTGSTMIYEVALGDITISEPTQGEPLAL